jgi:signal transduction histidine kinase
MKKFTEARLKLTIFYSLILLFVMLVLSGIYYQQTTSIIDFHSQRINQRLSQDFMNEGQGRGPKMPGSVVKAELAEARDKILKQIIIIDGILFIFSLGASYLLSGRTLKPIKKSLTIQKQFVADAAHELKTPLTALKTSVEVSLENKKLSKAAKEVLQDNLIEIKSLTKLTEDLLSLAQVEDENQFSFSPVSLNEVITEAVKQVKPLAEKKEIKISWPPKGANSKESFVVLGDKAALIKTLVILIDNAIKYSPRQSKIELNLEKKKKQTIIEVIDQGRGIPQDKIDKIFERFYRVEKARTKNEEGGYGLGLAVAKKIIDQHQAAISVESEIGKGSRFILKFKDQY